MSSLLRLLCALSYLWSCVGRGELKAAPGGLGTGSELATSAVSYGNAHPRAWVLLGSLVSLLD